MDMEVGHAFSRIRTVVDYEAVSAFLDTFLARDLSRGEQQLAEQGCIVRANLADSGDRFARDDEDMDRGLRVDVAYGENVIVLADHLRGDLSRGNALEKCHVSSTSSERRRRSRAACPRT